LGTPDLVVTVPQPFMLPAGKGDAFRNFAVPIPLNEARWVRGIEVDPGNARVVHHASISIDRTRASRRLEESDPLPGFSGGMFAETAESPDSRALGWTPGLSPLFEPEGMAWRLPKGSDLVIQLHMIPDANTATQIQPRVAFYFSAVPPSRPSIDVRLGSRDIDIPLGDANYGIADAFTLPVDVQLISVYPHAHYLAKEMRVEATTADGRVQPLLSIPRWDFHWQEEYRYAVPVTLPRGTVIRMRYVYDNSLGNRRRAAGVAAGRVVYGPMSSDEMGDLWLRLSPVVPGDAGALARAFVDHERNKALALSEKRVAADPRSAASRNALGASYLDAGRIADAIATLTESIRLQPSLAEAHNNLSQAWRRSGRPREAIAEGREAVRLAPDNHVAWLNFGNVLLDNGDLEEAIAAFTRALSLNPSLAEAHNNIGIALGALKRYDEAEARFREALDIQPDFPDALRNLDMLRGRR
jgi:tetratricopeptide (TPR) repeat protein